MPHRSVSDSLLLLSTVVTAVSGVLLALTNLNDTLSRARESFLSLPKDMAWALAALMATLAIAAGTSAMWQRSRLTRRSAFRLRPDCIEHLHGREEDISRLARVLQEYPQVNIIGESGAGKSALMQSGIMPRLEGSQLIAIYVDTLGHDWIQGPESATRAALSSNEIAAEVRDLPTAADRAIAAGKKLLIIFDQFDDYQSNHHDHFITPQTQTFLSRGELLRTNPFWAGVEQLVRTNKIHCAFVTRNDSAAGLECVRFVEPRVYLLDRLRATAVDELLDTLTESSAGTPPVIEAPGKGWSALRNRLVRDLGVDGAVLPAQMAIALAGLTTFRYLTVREYQRRGGLHGLEGAEVEWRIANTAHRGELTSTQALSLFLTLVDRESRKTRARTLDEIVAMNPAIPAKSIAPVLQEWESKELLRRRADSDTGNAVWLLDHDYLCKAVLAAEARLVAGSIMIRDGAADFEASGNNLLRRWRTLLTPAQQFAVWTQRLRRGLRFADHRGYVALSTLRFIPYLAIIAVLGVIAYQRHVLKYERAAEAILQDLTFTNDAPATDTLWALVEAQPQTKTYFVRSSLRSMTAAKMVQPTLGAALRAVIGADNEMRERIRTLLKDYALSRWQTPPVRIVAIKALHEIGGVDSEVMSKALDLDESHEIISGPSPAVNESDWARIVHYETSERLSKLSGKLVERILDRSTAVDSVKSLASEAAAQQEIFRNAVVILQGKANVLEPLISRLERAATLDEVFWLTEIVGDVRHGREHRQRIAQRLLGILPTLKTDAEVLRCLYAISRFYDIVLTPSQREQTVSVLYGQKDSEVPCAWLLAGAKALASQPASSADALRLFAFLNILKSRCSNKELDSISGALLPHMNSQDRAEAVQLRLGAEMEEEIEARPAVVQTDYSSEGMGRPDRIVSLSKVVDDLRSRGVPVTSQEGELIEILTGWANDRKRDLALVDLVVAASTIQRPLPPSVMNGIREECRRATVNPDAKALLHIFDMLTQLEREHHSTHSSAPKTAGVIRETLLANLSALPEAAAVSLANKLLDADLENANVDVLLRSVCSSISRKTFWREQFKKELHIAQTDTAAVRIGVALLSSPRASLQSYVDVFRTPTCGPKCRSTVVALAGERTQRKFFDEWAFVEWVTTQDVVVEGAPLRRRDLYYSN